MNGLVDVLSTPVILSSTKRCRSRNMTIVCLKIEVNKEKRVCTALHGTWKIPPHLRIGLLHGSHATIPIDNTNGDLH